jgi:CheY-like chemotaxis protein
VLLDLRMPRLSGDEAFERLRALDPAQAARVVFVTGDVRSEHTRAFLEASGRPAVAKPFRFEVLREVLARVVEAGGAR